MAKNLSIDEYKKQRKRKKIIKNAVAFAILLSVIIATLFIWQAMVNNNKNNKNFPVSLSGDLIVNAQIQSNNVTLLTDKELLFYNLNGKKLKSVGHSNRSPVISTAKNDVLMYDANGYNFSVENISNTVLNQTTTEKIYLGALADNGNIAIVTSDSRYACSLTIYDNKGKGIYKWYSAENLITSISFTHGGKGCALTTVGVAGGLTNTVVYGLEFSKNTETFKAEIKDSLGVGVKLIGGFYHVVCDDGLTVMDQKGSVQKTINFDNTLKQFEFANDQYTVILLGEEVKANNYVGVYDQNGNKVGEELTNNNIKAVASDGSYVVTLTDSSIKTSNMIMKTIKEYDNRKNATNILCGSSNGIEMNTTYFDKFELS